MAPQITIAISSHVSAGLNKTSMQRCTYVISENTSTGSSVYGKPITVTIINYNIVFFINTYCSLYLAKKITSANTLNILKIIIA